MSFYAALLIPVLGLASSLWAADAPAPADNGLAKLLADGAKLEKLATGFQFVEGPVWLDADGGRLIFSDIPANHLKIWTPAKGVGVFRDDSRSANGNARDRAGRLLTCEHGSRSVTRTEADGKITVLAREYQGKRLNSPNDLAVKSDGTIWFTDPTYGLKPADKELPGNYVYRLDPRSNQLTAVILDSDMPNGIAFSPDEKKLYVADSGKPHHIRVFDVSADGTAANGRVFCTITPGVPDGIRCDEQGRVWSSAGDGVQVFAPDGRRIATIAVPESPANLCFGGKDGRTVFITARTSLYAIERR